MSESTAVDFPEEGPGLDARRFVSDDERLFEVFHENTKLNLLTESQIGLKFAELLQDPTLGKLVANSARSNYSLPRLSLPPCISIVDSFSEVVLGRRSCHAFSGDAIDLDALSTLLHHAYGITGQNKLQNGTLQQLRSVPSGGALYPLDVYIVASNVNGLRRGGVYRYDGYDNALEDLGKAVSVGEQAANFPGGAPEWVSQAAACVVITACFARTCFKYGDRGYRLVLFEAGSVATQLNFTAHALGLGSCQLSGFYDDSVNVWLNIDGCNDAAIGIVLVGIKSIE